MCLRSFRALRGNGAGSKWLDAEARSQVAKCAGHSCHCCPSSQQENVAEDTMSVASLNMAASTPLSPHHPRPLLSGRLYVPAGTLHLGKTLWEARGHHRGSEALGPHLERKGSEA